MVNPKEFELIWQGRIHVGDEPGVYGDATYVGLSAEWALTVYPYDVQNGPTVDPSFVIRAENVRSFGGAYKGHRITATLYEDAGDFQWREVELDLGDTRLTTDEVRFTLPLLAHPRAPRRYVSIRVRADTVVTPGLYSDFLLRQLVLEPDFNGFYASLGFDYNE